MSQYAGGNSGRTRFKTQILLHLYDLSPANDILYPLGLGLHHSGIEISGVEYSFAGNPQASPQTSGIFESPPKQVPNAKFRQSIIMGYYEGSSADIRAVLSDLGGEEFLATKYHLLKRNCNHFCNALCWRLLGKTIPAFVNRLANLGGCCGCLLPKALLEDAPVGGSGGAGGSGGSGEGGSGTGFTMSGGRRGDASSDTSSSVKAFGGSGMTLGGGASSSSSSGMGLTHWMRRRRENNGNDVEGAVEDRREKARKAALARLEQRQEGTGAGSASGGGGAGGGGTGQNAGGFKSS